MSTSRRAFKEHEYLSTLISIREYVSTAQSRYAFSQLCPRRPELHAQCLVSIAHSRYAFSQPNYAAVSSTPAFVSIAHSRYAFSQHNNLSCKDIIDLCFNRSFAIFLLSTRDCIVYNLTQRI